MKRFSVLLVILIVAFASAANAKSDIDVKAEVKFLKSIPLHATFGQVKKLLPPGVNLGKARWAVDETPLIVGNLVNMSGRLNGMLSFLTRSQYKILANDHSSSSAVTKYKSTDPIYAAVIGLRGGTKLSKSQGEKRVRVLIQLFGKPKAKVYTTSEDDPGGWYVKWQLSNKGIVEYYSAGNYLHLNFFDAYGYQP